MKGMSSLAEETVREDISQAIFLSVDCLGIMSCMDRANKEEAITTTRDSMSMAAKSRAFSNTMETSTKEASKMITLMETEYLQQLKANILAAS